MSKEFEIAAKLLVKSKYAIAFTGAGISAESGIPTFRGRGGLWEKYDPNEFATVSALRKNPKKVWKFYVEFFNLMKNSKPNKAHIAIGELEKMGIIKAVITQNIDDLHERGGTKNIIKLHGWYNRLRCDNCGYRTEIEELPEEMPRCPECGENLRPDVVLFGERLPSTELDAAFIEANKADLVLVVGTSGVVMPAAYIPWVVKNNNGKIIEINYEPTVITSIADLSLFGKAGEILPKIVDLVKKAANKL